MEEFRTDLLRTTSPLRLIALRAGACFAGALLLGTPFMLLGGAAGTAIVSVLAAHAALSVAAVSWAELGAVRTGRLARGAVLAGALAAAVMSLGLGQAWFAGIAWSRGHDVAYAAIQDGVRALAAGSDMAVGCVTVGSIAVTALWALPVGLLTFERLHGRAPEAFPLLLLFMGWVPGLLVLVALAAAYAMAAGWDEALGGSTSRLARDGSETNRPSSRLVSGARTGK